MTAHIGERISEMTTELTLFHFDDSRESFEDLSQPNGATHWREADVMRSLGYESREGFRRALTRAKQACLSLGLACEEHFLLGPDGEHLLTRFGCYLVAMNGDPRKPEVAAAQVYFAALAETFQSHLEHADGIDRILIRDEVTDGQKSLASTAKAHGIQNYAFFQNKGYLGMYNMSLDRLMQYKGVLTGEKFIDRMSKTELAAHLFRITQTEQKVKNQGVRGQVALEKTAYEVGRTVRNTMIDLSGTEPENLPIGPHIKDVKKRIKSTSCLASLGTGKSSRLG
jgi:DNA-damage-inducible protein D